MNKRIVHTRHSDGGVTVTCPAVKVITWMGCGGYWNAHSRGFVDVQIERQIEAGIAPDVARRYARAMQFGGCTTAEALEIIRDRDCAPHGTAIELWDARDVPTDRWFRDAWRRSPNGGPISINLKLARPIQWRRARDAVSQENKRRADEFDEFLKPQIDVDWAAFRERLARARDDDDLRRIWPIHQAGVSGNVSPENKIKSNPAANAGHRPTTVRNPRNDLSDLDANIWPMLASAAPIVR